MVWISIASACTLLLYGCLFLERGNDRPVAVQRSGDELVIAVCDDISVDFVSMEERNIAAGRPWHRFWESNEFREYVLGDVLMTEGVSAERATIAEKPGLEANDQIAVLLRGSSADGRGTSIDAVFQIGDDGLSESEWLHADSSLTSEPCNSISE